jgi:hypothetical protein
MRKRRKEDRPPRKPEDRPPRKPERKKRRRKPREIGRGLTIFARLLSSLTGLVATVQEFLRK